MNKVLDNRIVELLYNLIQSNSDKEITQKAMKLEMYLYDRHHKCAYYKDNSLFETLWREMRSVWRF